MTTAQEQIVVAPCTAPLAGTLAVPGDKSVTHRALFFGAMNRGLTTIHNPSPAEDPLSTLRLLEMVGYSVRREDGRWVIPAMAATGHREGVTLDCGNSGTTARLGAGFLTGESGMFALVGDRSLMRRPMNRVVEPLAALGADVQATGGTMPLAVLAHETIAGLPADRPLDVSSAQVHGSLLLAGLRSRLGVALRRTAPMRDHSLRMARAFGIEIETDDDGGMPVDRVRPVWIDRAVELHVPGDLSSAAFFVAAALLVPGSHISLENVGLNPTRTTFLRTLERMGARLEWTIIDDACEPSGIIHAGHSPELRGIMLGEGSEHADLPIGELIDELPLLALIASQAHGRTVVRGAAELRVKESDRIAATMALLRALGMEGEELEDGFAVEGPQQVAGGGAIDHHGDHRLCMIAAVAALIAREPVPIPHPEIASVSYPGFWDHLGSLGATITPSVS